jgi:hypothetical protein
MSTGEDREIDEAITRAYAAHEVPEPLPGLADRVVHRLAAGEADRRVGRRSRWPLVALALAASAAAALLIVLGWPRAGGQEGWRETTTRETIAVGGRAVAVAEPSTTLRWRVGPGGDARVDLTRGAAFFRVDPGSVFEVFTPHASVEVTGTCFKLEVNDMTATANRLLGAAAGAGLAALVVTVYEGSVRVKNAQGEVEVASGSRATVSAGSAPRLTPTLTAAAPASVPRLSAQALHASGADARATIVALEEKVASLSAELEKARRELRDGPLDQDGIPKNKFFDLTPDELAVLARRCELRYDVPPFLMNAAVQASPELAARVGLSEAERVRTNQALRESSTLFVGRLRALYAEAHGAPPPETMSARDLQHAIFGRYPREIKEAFQRLSRERAGLATPPADPSGSSVVERELRLILEAGDDWERRLAGIIGPDRARQLRRNSEANGARRIQRDCPD